MKRINGKVIAITVLLCLLPIALGISFYEQLPDNMAVHFDINNQPDNYAPKAFAVFGIPILMAVLQAICCIISDIRMGDKQGKNTKLEKITKAFIPVLNIVIYGIMIYISLGRDIDVRKSILWIIGILLILMGNYLPKTSAVQVHLPFFLKAKENWKRTGMILGYTYVIFGFLFIGSLFLPPIYSVILIPLLLIITFIEICFCHIKKDKIKE